VASQATTELEYLVERENIDHRLLGNGERSTTNTAASTDARGSIRARGQFDLGEMLGPAKILRAEPTPGEDSRL
jgi:hypothetical protein